MLPVEYQHQVGEEQQQVHDAEEDVGGGTEPAAGDRLPGGNLPRVRDLCLSPATFGDHQGIAGQRCRDLLGNAAHERVEQRTSSPCSQNDEVRLSGSDQLTHERGGVAPLDHHAQARASLVGQGGRPDERCIVRVRGQAELLKVALPVGRRVQCGRVVSVEYRDPLFRKKRSGGLEGLAGRVREIGRDDDVSVRRAGPVGDYEQWQLRAAQQPVDRFAQCQPAKRLVARDTGYDEITTLRFCDFQDSWRRVALLDSDRDLVTHAPEVVAQLPSCCFDQLRVRVKRLREALAPDGTQPVALLQYVNDNELGVELPCENGRTVHGPIAASAQICRKENFARCFHHAAILYHEKRGC